MRIKFRLSEIYRDLEYSVKIGRKTWEWVSPVHTGALCINGVKRWFVLPSGNKLKTVTAVFTKNKINNHQYQFKLNSYNMCIAVFFHTGNKYEPVTLPWSAGCIVAYLYTKGYRYIHLEYTEK